MATHQEKLLRLLSDKKWHSNSALAKVAGFRYGAVVHVARNRGYNIESRKVSKSPAHWEYRLTRLTPN